MAGSVKGLIVEIGGDTSGLQKALSKVNSATSSLSRELRGINSLLKLDPTNTELLKQKQDILNKSIETTQSRLKELKKVKEEADNKMAEGTEINEENYRALQREIINTENKLKQLQLEASKWNKAGQKLDEIGTKIQNIGERANSVGNSLSTKLTLPIAGLATVGVTYNAQLEKYTKSFETFLGSAEKASEAVQKIKEDASKTPFDTASLIQANQMLISTGENSDDARENILALGEAIIATGGGNDELTRMSANLQQVKNAGKATVLDIKQFAYAGIDIYGLLADYTGKSVEEVKDMEVSYEDLTKALKKASQKGGKYYNAMSNASETLTGQTSQLTAEIKDGIGELTKGLMPIAKKVVAQAKELITQFNQLDDTQKENILRMGLMVAAAGPLLKIFGTITSTAGGVAKGIGTVSTAIGVMKTGAKSSSASANTLAKVLKALTSPTGLAVAGITAVAGALIYLSTRETEQQKQIKELCQNIDNAGKSLDEFNQQVDNSANTELSHINNVQKLKNELDSLVDENGKVKKSDEARANFIIGQLNEALGTEIKLTDGQIDNYKDLQSEIDKTIEKKKAEIKLSAEEEKYKNAIEKREEATKNLKETLSQLGMSYDEAKTKAEEYKQKMQDETLTIDDLKNCNIGLLSAFTEADEQVRTNTENIKQYEQDYASFTEGKYNEIGNIVKTTTQDWTDTSLQEIKNSIQEQKKDLEYYKQIYEATGDEVAKQSMEQAQTNLNNLTEELKARTSTINTMSKDEILAWATMAKENREKYNEEMNNAEGDTKLQLEAIAKAVDQNKNLPEKEMELLAETMAESFTTMDSSKWGTDLIQGLASGIRQKAQTTLNSAVQEATKIIHANLHFSRPDEGPLRNYETWMPDMIKGLSKTLKKSSPLLENSALELSRKLKENLDISQMDFGKTNLSSKVIDSIKTVFTTPQIVFNVQELDEAKLQQCFNYINRKFGSQY